MHIIKLHIIMYLHSKHKLFCYNCYNTQHISKYCPNPVVSYGIICYYFANTGKRKYMMVQRKHSFAFVGFVTGKYEINNENHLQDMFNKMTRCEHQIIATSEFMELWNKLWEGYETRKHKKSTQREALKCNLKFQVLKRKDKINYFIRRSNCEYTSPEWYFPKGRLENQFERPKDCALREFEEETQINKKKIILKRNMLPVVEKHKANERLYQVVFYFAEYKGENREISTFCRNREIANAAWLDMDQCMKKIRPYENEKIELLKRLSKQKLCIRFS